MTKNLERTQDSKCNEMTMCFIAKQETRLPKVAVVGGNMFQLQLTSFGHWKQ